MSVTVMIMGNVNCESRRNSDSTRSDIEVRGRSGARDRSDRHACAICGWSDSRGLVDVELASGGTIVVCGTHSLMLQRASSESPVLSSATVTVDDVRAVVGERRERARDRRNAEGDVDELAEALAAAFVRDRRLRTRRAQHTIVPSVTEST